MAEATDAPIPNNDVASPVSSPSGDVRLFFLAISVMSVAAFFASAELENCEYDKRVKRGIFKSSDSCYYKINGGI